MIFLNDPVQFKRDTILKIFFFTSMQSNNQKFFLQITNQRGNYSALFGLRFYCILTPKIIEFAMCSLTTFRKMYEYSHFFTCLIHCKKVTFCKIVKKQWIVSLIYLNLRRKTIAEFKLCLCITQNGAKANIKGYEFSFYAQAVLFLCTTSNLNLLCKDGYIFF